MQGLRSKLRPRCGPSGAQRITNASTAQHNTKVKHVTYRSEGVKPRTEEEAELDGIEQVGLAGTIPTDDRVRGRRERVDLRLLPERTEVRYCYSGGATGAGGENADV